MGSDEEIGWTGRGFEMCVYEERIWCLRRLVRADNRAVLSFSVCCFAVVVDIEVWGGDCEGYRVRSTEKKAGYAAERRWIDSFSGVIVGRERRHGLRASWKTESRLVRRRMVDFAAERGERMVARMEHPAAL